jgi:hypothetical protein
MNGWTSRELRLNEESKAPIRTKIITIDIGDNNKKVGVRKSWTKRKGKKEMALAQGEQKNDGQGKRVAKERNNFNKRETKRKRLPRK